MARRTPLLVVAVAVALALTGCTPTSPGSSDPTPSGTSAAPEESTAPEPTGPERAIVTLDGLEIETAEGTTSIDFTDTEAVLQFFEESFGEEPEVSTDDQGYGFTYNDWDGLRVTIGGQRASLLITTATVGDVPIETAEGLAVGSSRADAVAAGAWDDWDDDKADDLLGITARDVPGTESLVHPGEVGREYLLLVLNDDRIERILTQANDFSDL